MKSLGWLAQVTALVLASIQAFGQTVTDGNQTGFPVFGTFHGSDLDLVSLQNGNLHIDIPIATFPQRNGQFNYSFIYDTPSYTLTYSKDPAGVVWDADTAPDEQVGVGVGWRMTNSLNWRVSWQSQQLSCTVNDPMIGPYQVSYGAYSNFAVIDPDGGKHPLALRFISASNASNASLCNDSSTQLTSLTLDGTGTFVQITDSTSFYSGFTVSAILKDGTQVVNGYCCTGWRDSNGNTASTSPDMLGRNNMVTTNGSGYTLYTVTDSNGNAQNFRVDWISINVASNFCPLRSSLTGGAAPCYEYGSTWQVPSRLTLPDGLYYQFTWNADGTLQQMNLPTGGSVTYSYVSMRFNGVYSGAGCVKTDPNCVPTTTYPVRQTVSSRAVTNNGTTATWNYAGYPAGRTGSGLPPGGTTVSNPLGNQQVHTFGCCSNTQSYETQVKYYQGSSSTGTLLRTINKDYAADASPLVVGEVINVRPIRETTVLENSQTKKTETDYETSTATCNSCSQLSTYTTTRLNALKAREYDWGSGAAGPLLRTTSSAYLHASNANYLNANIADRPISETIYDGSGNIVAQTTFAYDGSSLTPTSGAPNHDYTNFSTSNTLRGNLTQTSHWLNTSNTWLSMTNTYDDLGNLRSTSDPLNHTTTFSYTDSFSGSACVPSGVNTQAYITQTTNALGQNTATKYYPCTGLIAAKQNQNDINAGRAGTTFTYDGMNRPASTNFPDGGSVTYDYSDNHSTAPPLWASSSTLMNASTGLSTTRISVLDGLGRMQQHKSSVPTAQCNSGYIYQDFTYDALGHSATTSNPYCTTSDPTYGLITNAYDALGRTTQATKQDGSVTTASYAGNCTSAADEAGKSRKSCSDGLGRLTNVWEDPSGLNYETDYQYDALGNLLRVDQKGSAPTDSTQWRTRLFTYDSLSRLLTANNPESGTISYCYDADSNLLTKTDARGVTTTHAYDQLHRVTSKTHSDTTTPASSFVYDQPNPWGWSTLGNPIGQLVAVNTGGSNGTSRVFSYDAVGRQTTEWQCQPSCPAASAQYNLAGELTSLTYPSGRTVKFGYNSGAQLDQVTYDNWNGNAVGYSYWSVNDANFYPNGTPRLATLGNGVTEATTLNKRLQLQEETVTNSTIGILADHAYSYGMQNNGNILSAMDQLNPARTQTFTYDPLNRLATANESRWGLSFSYDPWGNRLQQNVTAGNAGQMLLTADGKNRIAGAVSNCTATTEYCYDLAGNMLNDGFHKYAFDAESRISTVDNSGATYTYDADGNRLRKDISGGPSTIYFYFGGQAVAELDVANNFWTDYVEAGGTRIAKADTFINMARTQGTCSTPSSGCKSTFWFRNSGLVGYKIQSGDKLFILQNVMTGAAGGPGLTYKDANGNVTQGDTISNVFDQNGCPMNQDCASGMNYYRFRRMDLTPLAGMTIADDPLVETNWTSSSSGSWEALWADFVLVGADGTVHPIFAGTAWGQSITLASSNQAGTSNVLGFVDKELCWTCAGLTTNFYHDDQIGSSRMLTAGGGWPVWQGTFLPYGEEYNNPQITPNHYKFTGKERDNESGLDYFGARYYGNTLGRFLTPDWAAIPEPVPYADFHDPQSLNQYSYVRNIPTVRVDGDGHDVWTFAKVVVTVTLSYLGERMHKGFVDIGHFMTSGPPHGVPTLPGICTCPPSANQNQNNNNQSNNSNQQATKNQQSNSRLPQDKAVNPKPPAANNGKGTVGPNANQNAKAQADAAAARADGATDIRVNQQQVNANGERVGINRPDLQYTDKNGVRQYTEYERSANGSGDAHAQRTQANDPNAATKTKVVK